MVVPATHPPNLSSWRSPMTVSDDVARLVAIDPSSTESINMIRLILPRCQELGQKDSQAFIDVLDLVRPCLNIWLNLRPIGLQAMASIQADMELYKSCLAAFRRICGSQGILPSSHILPGRLAKKNLVPSAQDDHADVWEGTYEDSALVAIKSLKVHPGIGLIKVKKVWLVIQQAPSIFESSARYSTGKQWPWRNYLIQT